MASLKLEFDALILGAGFYGCQIALELKRQGFGRVGILERETGIMQRASYVNQARIHNGYHYPRSVSTAARSHENFERFVCDFEPAVYRAFEKIYAIAYGSRINASQYERFCATLDLPCTPVPERMGRLFDNDLIEGAFLTRELAFDAQILAAVTSQQLSDAGVELILGQEAKISNINGSSITVACGEQTLHAAHVFNCTYGEIDLAGIPLQSRIKRELTEMVLIAPPAELEGLGITVMDGPFFSTMPFPAAGAHSLSHVRYTPHESWIEPLVAPITPQRSNREAMVRDAARYLPCLGKARILRSLFDLKAVLVKNEDDDGRPILFEQSDASPRIISILGSKFDNIYDVLEQLRVHSWEL